MSDEELHRCLWCSARFYDYNNLKDHYKDYHKLNDSYANQPCELGELHENLNVSDIILLKYCSNGQSVVGTIKIHFSYNSFKNTFE